MSLSKDTQLTFAAGANSIPAGAGVEVFKGSMISVSADSSIGVGYGNPLVAGEVFAGHAMEGCDNTDGDAGDLDIQLRCGAPYRLVVDLAASQESIGVAVYASDDETYTLTAGSNSKVGILIRVRNATQCEVLFQPFCT